MNDNKNQIIEECKREEENCLYTSTTFFLWLSSMRKGKSLFIATPLLLGGIASIEILSNSESDIVKYIIALAAFFGGVIPSIFSALKIDSKINIIDGIGSKYKILQGKFRRIRNINSNDSDFEQKFNTIIDELEILKSSSLTAPERFFKKAQSKITKGDYNYSCDEKK